MPEDKDTKSLDRRTFLKRATSTGIAALVANMLLPDVADAKVRREVDYIVISSAYNTKHTRKHADLRENISRLEGNVYQEWSYTARQDGIERFNMSNKAYHATWETDKDGKMERIHLFLYHLVDDMVKKRVNSNFIGIHLSRGDQDSSSFADLAEAGEKHIKNIRKAYQNDIPYKKITDRIGNCPKQ